MTRLFGSHGGRTASWSLASEEGRVQICSPAPRDDWSQVLQADPTATPSQTPTWLDCVCRSDGWTDASRLYRLPHGRTLILPLVRRRIAGLRGPVPAIQASFPHGWSTGGLLAPGGASAADIALVRADLSRHPALRTLIRPGYIAADAWDSATATHSRIQPVRRAPRNTHVLDLSGGFEEVWSHRFTAKARSGIRNAERKAAAAGVDIRLGNSPDLVADFYGVYLRWLELRSLQWGALRPAARWWSRPEPLRRFHTVADALGTDCRIWIACLDGTPIAANIVLLHGQLAVGWRAYADRSLTASLRTQELLQCRSVEYACKLGCSTFIMGESGGVTGIKHVKDRLGATEFEGAEYLFERLPIPALDAGRDALRRVALRIAAAIPDRSKQA
ncbi:GNAT family N-acetyltransferase [Nocardia heshunensis]